MSEAELPVQFGRYTLSGLLGEGGMARVFRAELRGPSGFRKPSALKVIHASVAARNERLRGALVHEARLGGLLHHQNIVETYDYGEEEGQPFIAMELVEGIGLDELLRRPQGVEPGFVLEIGAQICAGLDHAHRLVDGGVLARLVHRDLKPSNVIISREGLVKVMDFGIAKAATLRGDATETGMTKGTPAYMSPEQAAAQPIDLRSDLFALGAILYELATGRRFFEGDSLLSIMMAVVHVEEQLARPATLEPVEGIVPGLEAVVRRCMRQDPEARWESARAVEGVLRGLQRRVPLPRPLKDWVQELLGPEARPAGIVLTPSRVEASRVAPATPAIESVAARRDGLATGPDLLDAHSLASVDMVPATEEAAPPRTSLGRSSVPGPTRAMVAVPARSPSAGLGLLARLLRSGTDRRATLGLVAGLLVLLLGASLTSWVVLRKRPVAPHQADEEAEDLVIRDAEMPSADEALPALVVHERASTTPEATPGVGGARAGALRATPARGPGRDETGVGPRASGEQPRADSMGREHVGGLSDADLDRPAGPGSGEQAAHGSVELRHDVPELSVLGSPNRLAVQVVAAEGTCRPELSYGPWSAADGGYDALPMASVGQGHYEAAPVIPYTEAYRSGFRYVIRCVDDAGRVVGTWPTNGQPARVPALAR